MQILHGLALIKLNLKNLFGKQKQASRILFNQDRFTHVLPLLRNLNVYQINFVTSTSVHAQDENKLITSDLPTSVVNNKS